MFRLCLLGLLGLSGSLAAHIIQTPTVPATTNLDPGTRVVYGVETCGGSYAESDVDLVVVCHEPIAIQRCHFGHERSEGGAIPIWHVQDERIHVFVRGKNRGQEVSLIESSGRALRFEADGHWNLSPGYRFPQGMRLVDQPYNNESGSIGGQNNARNYQLRYTGRTNEFHLVTGDGEERIYRCAAYPNYSVDKKGRNRHDLYLEYTLRSVTKPNGHRLHYRYDANGLVEISSTSADGLITYGWARFERTNGRFKRIVGSDGQELEYEWSGGQPFLKRVVRNGEVVDLYDHESCSLTHRQQNGSQFKAEFGATAHYQVCGKGQFGSYVDYHQIGRVFGSDGKSRERNLAQFTYKSNVDRKGRFLEGWCEVEESGGWGLARSFHFGQEGDLHHIYYSQPRHPNQFQGGKRTFNEWFEWYDHGYLKRKSITGSGDQVLFSRSFSYDAKGNVLQHTVSGNVTGHSLGGQEEIVTRYTYSQDGLNLPLSKREENLLTEYTYQEATNLPIRELRYDNDQIVERQFCEYDSNASLIQAVIDDGCSPDADCLDGVTYRYTLRISPRLEDPGVGLPEEAFYCYLDLDAGIEKILRREVLHYSSHNLVVQRDVYDEAGELRHTLFMDYDQHGRLVSQTDPLGNQTCFSYDENGNCTQVSGPKPGYEVQSTYDSNNHLIRKEVSDGTSDPLICEFHWDPRGNLSALRDEFDNVTQLSHNTFGDLCFLRFAALPTLRAGLSDRRTLVNSQFFQRSDVQWEGATIFRCLDPFGHVTAERDPNEYSTSYVRNVAGDPVEVTYPDGSSESYRYNLRGELVESTTRCGLKLRFERDYRGRITARERYTADGELVSREETIYKGLRLTSRTAADSTRTNYQYDGAGRLIEEQTNARRLTYEYDTLGRCARKTQWDEDSTISVAAFEFDLLDRIIEERTESPDGQVLTHKQFEYDELGRRITTVEFDATEAAHAWKVDYDPYGCPKRVVDPMGGEQIVERSSMSKVASNWLCDGELYKPWEVKYPQQIVTDAMGRQCCTTFNPRGEPISIERLDASGQLLVQSTYDYDDNGNCVRATFDDKDGEPIIHEWMYGPCNRLEAQVEAVDTAHERRTEYRYDPSGQLAQMVKPSGATLRFEYDSAGRLGRYQGEGFDYSYTYDTCDRIVSIRSPESPDQKRCYNDLGQLISETLANGLELHYEVDALGRRKRIILPDGSAIGYRFDAAFLREVIRYNAQGRRCYGQKYTAYDPSGHLLRTYPIAGDQPINYHWDALGRLNQVDGPWYLASGDLDSVDRLLSLSSSGVGGESACSWSYDDLDQLLEEAGDRRHHYSYDVQGNRSAKDGQAYEIDNLNQLLSSPTGEFRYDLDGRIVAISHGTETLLLEYDSLDRLVSVESANLALRFTYDAFNRRLSKEILLNEEGSWKRLSYLRFLWVDRFEIGAVDEQGSIVELRVMGAGFAQEAFSTVAIELDGEVYQPIHDFYGNTAGLLAMDGRLVEWYDFSAFGESFGSGLGNPWRFGGKRIDDETGFIYYGERYYLPSVGRWLTRDPAGFRDGPNLYAFSSNNPLGCHDAAGLWSIPLWGSQIEVSSPDNGSGSAIDDISPLISILLPPPSQPDNHPFYLTAPENYGDWIQWNRTWEDNHPTRSRMFEVMTPYRNDHPHLNYFFINGMCTTFEEARSHATQIAHNLQIGHLQCVYNATSGSRAVDLVECFLGLFCYHCMAPEKLLIKSWAGMVERDPNAKALQLSHSQGSIKVRNALMAADPALRQHVLSGAIAPGAYIWPTLCEKQVHFRVEMNTKKVLRFLPAPRLDVVPFMDRQGAKICKATTVVLKRHPDAVGSDHDCESLTYRGALLDWVEHQVRVQGRKEDD